jgi:hypothetical protein
MVSFFKNRRRKWDKKFFFKGKRAGCGGANL